MTVSLAPSSFFPFPNRVFSWGVERSQKAPVRMRTGAHVRFFSPSSFLADQASFLRSLFISDDEEGK